MNIIDSAVRLPSEHGLLLIDGLLQQMDEWSVSHAVVAPSDEFTAVYNEDGNEQLAGLMRSYPERVSGLAVANVWYGKRAVEIVQLAFDAGLIGLYLDPGRQGFHLTDEMVDPLIELCIACERPIYSHTGTPICAMPFQLAELGRRHPKAKLVMGHAGWSDFCGYDVIPAACQAKNIFVETSCATGDFVRRLIGEIGPERVVFGSAYPRSRYRHEINKIAALNLSPDVFGKVMHENAERLWKIVAA